MLSLRKASSPRTIYGHLYPWPAFLGFFVIYSFLMQCLVSRAAAPEGRCPIEGRGYFVHLYVCVYIHPYIQLPIRKPGS